MLDKSCARIIAELRAKANPENVKGMTRFGINPNNTLGLSVAELRTMAKPIGKDHALAQELWSSGIHEARILACLVDDASLVTEKQMEAWVRDFDSWDVCDQCCMNLFDRTGLAYEKAIWWSSREEEFVRRAGFALMASLAVHDKMADDERFLEFLPRILEAADDERNYVKKSVNWALRQIGKRNLRLNVEAINLAKEIGHTGSRSARWVAADALRELTSNKVQARLRGKAARGRRTSKR